MWRKEKSQLLLAGPFQHSAAETAHLGRSQAGGSVLLSVLHPPLGSSDVTQITEETGGYLPDLNDHCIFWEVFHTLKEKIILKKIHHHDKAVDFLGIGFLENTVQCSSSCGDTFCRHLLPDILVLLVPFGPQVLAGLSTEVGPVL